MLSSGCNSSDRTAATTTTAVAADPAKVARLAAGVGVSAVLPTGQQECLLHRLAAGLGDAGMETLSRPSPPLAALSAADAATFDAAVRACVQQSSLTASLVGALQASHIKADDAACLAYELEKRHGVVELYRMVLGADAEPTGKLSDEMYRAATDCKVFLPGSGL